VVGNAVVDIVVVGNALVVDIVVVGNAVVVVDIVVVGNAVRVVNDRVGNVVVAADVGGKYNEVILGEIDLISSSIIVAGHIAINPT